MSTNTVFKAESLKARCLDALDGAEATLELAIKDVLLLIHPQATYMDVQLAWGGPGPVSETIIESIVVGSGEDKVERYNGPAIFDGAETVAALADIILRTARLQDERASLYFELKP